MSDLDKLKSVASDKTLLYIESDETLQRNFGIFLKKIFKEFYQEYNGEDGFETYLKKKPDIVIIDLALEKKDAIEFIADIQENTHKPIVVTLSVHNENYSLLQSIDMGLAGMLLKPINFAQLASKLLQVLPKPKKVEQPKIIKKEKVVLKTPVVIPPKKTDSPKIEEKIEPIVEEKPKPTVVVEQPKPKPKVEKSCMDDIKELFEAKESLVLINTYKGITIQNKGDFIHFSPESFELKTTVAQMVAANYEKHIVIKTEDKNRYIYANIASINLKSNILKLVNPKYIDYTQRETTNLRILADKSFRASLFFHKKHYDFIARQVSLNSIVLFSKEPIDEFKVDMELDFTFGFEIHSPSSLIKEKKFTKIFAKGKIMRIDKTPSGYEIPLLIQIQKSGQSTYKKYLKERENEIIEELKNKIRR